MNKKTLLTLCALLAVSAAAVAAEGSLRSRASCCPDPATCCAAAPTGCGTDAPTDCCDDDCCEPGCCSAK